MNEELREKLISDLKKQIETANKLIEEMNTSELAEKLPIEESLKLVESYMNLLEQLERIKDENTQN